LVFVFIGTIAVVNWSDEAPDPELTKILKTPFALAPKEFYEAHELLSEIELEAFPSDISCFRSYCASAQLQEELGQIESFFAKRPHLMPRIERFFSYGGWASADRDLPFRHLSKFRRAHHAQLLSIRRDLERGKNKLVLAKLKRHFQFVSGSRKYFGGLIENAVHLRCLKNVRQFVVSAARDSAAFRALLTPQELDEFRIVNNWDESIQGLYKARLHFNQWAFSKFRTWDAVVGSSPDGDAENKVPTENYVLDKVILPITFKKQATANAIYQLLKVEFSKSCISSEEKCPNEDAIARRIYSLYNPVENYSYIPSFMAMRRSRDLEMLYDNIEELKKAPAIH
jgi:hypothetical protein